MTQSEVRKRLGLKLRLARVIRDLTQDQVAKMSGVTQRRISEIERGSTAVTVDVLHRLTEALNLEIRLVTSEHIPEDQKRTIGELHAQIDRIGASPWGMDGTPPEDAP